MADTVDTAVTVLNYFKLPGPDRNNKLIIEGTIATDNDQNIETVIVTGKFNFTASGGRTFLIPGFNGSIIRLSGVITTTAATAITIIGFKIGGVIITGGNIMVANGDPIGEAYVMTPTDNNLITALQPIEVIISGGGYNSGVMEISAECQIH